MTDNDEQRMIELEQLIKDLRAQLPAHSVKPEMLMRIEDLEDELDQLKNKSRNKT
jgi:hypothetical protein